MQDTSVITGKTYNKAACSMILNPVQIAKYIKNGALPLDITVERDDKLCFWFDRMETRELKKLWDDHNLI